MTNVTTATRIFITVILTFIVSGTVLAQLQTANSIKTLSEQKLITPIEISAPRTIDTISLKFDTTNIFKIGKQAKLERSEEYFNSIKNVSVDLIESNNKMIEAQNRISELTKNKGKLTEAERQEIVTQRLLVKVLTDSINNLTANANKLKKDLDGKSNEATDQEKMKREYRNEYYGKLVAEARSNMQILKTNHDKYKVELKSKEDSLAPIKWPLYASNKDSMVREMGALYSRLQISTNTVRIKLENLVSDYPLLESKLKEFEEIDVLIRIGGQPDAFIDSIFSKRKIDLFNQFAKEKIHNDAFQKVYENYRSDFEVVVSKINAIWVKYKPLEMKQSSDASILANFIQPLNQSSSLVPGIDIFAYKKYGSRDLSMYGQAKLFLAAPGSDSNRLNRATKLFIPEASQLGFMADFTFGFLPASSSPSDDSKKRLGINLAFCYLQKQLVTKDTTKSAFGIGMVQVKAGLELIIIKNALSIYGNLNGYLVGKGLENYNKDYIKDNKMKWYSEFGIRSYLVLQSDAKINLLLDLRFLPVGKAIKETTFTEDKFIPVFKLGIVKEFEF